MNHQSNAWNPVYLVALRRQIAREERAHIRQEIEGRYKLKSGSNLFADRLRLEKSGMTGRTEET